MIIQVQALVEATVPPDPLAQAHLALVPLNDPVLEKYKSQMKCQKLNPLRNLGLVHRVLVLEVQRVPDQGPLQVLDTIKSFSWLCQ